MDIVHIASSSARNTKVRQACRVRLKKLLPEALAEMGASLLRFLLHGR